MIGSMSAHMICKSRFKNSEVILSTDKDTRELKGADVVQNYVNEEINECKAPSEDIVLINKDGWRFYDCNKMNIYYRIMKMLQCL